MVCPEGRKISGGGEMTHASLFSGIGGAEIAATMMGFPREWLTLPFLGRDGGRNP